MQALIGHTGLVGSTLLRQHPIDRCFHRANLHTLPGQRFERLFIAAMPAEKWRANAEPAADLANMHRLLDAVLQAHAQQVVLFSTVDVYARPWDVDESSEPGVAAPYGAHRLALEEALRQRWPDMLVLRLPGLFGAGLKKNALHDLLHRHDVHRLHPDGLLQWYPLARLSADMHIAMAAGLRLVNLATAPLRTGDIAERVFGVPEWPAPGQAGPPAYRMRSLHAERFGGAGGYCLEAPAVWQALRDWLAAEPAWAEPKADHVATAP
jgi:nucleoside-diphosphate-sugar epimerase